MLQYLPSGLLIMQGKFKNIHIVHFKCAKIQNIWIYSYK